MTGAPEQRREPVKTEDAVASFMRNTAARNWQEPTQRKFRTLLVDRLQFYTASKGYRYLNQMTLDVITEFRATDALLKLGILDGVMLCRPRQAGGTACGRHFLPGHRSVACSGSYDNPSALRAREIVAEGGRGWAGSFHSADSRTEGRIIDL